MRVLSFMLSFFCILGNLAAQKHDNIWLLGYCGCGNNPPISNDEFGVEMGLFDNSLHLQDIGNKPVNLSETNTSISDSLGNLLFYTNGERVYNKNHLTMDNGAGLVINGTGYGDVFPQSSLILPSPDQPNIFFLFQVEYGQVPNAVIGVKLFINTIDMAKNLGVGKVIEKRKLLLEDTLALDDMVGIKHANGRDWWIIVPQANSNGYFMLLLTKLGVISIKYKTVGSPVEDGLGQAISSLNGNMYIRSDHVKLSEPYHINIYDFDRCEGELSNQRTGYFDSIGYAAGVSASPDSRYLYVSRTQFIFQYDLSAPNIFATEKLIATHDGAMSGNHATYSFVEQLAPDGRIYVSTGSSTFRMHVINHPTRGDDPGWVQDGVKLRFRNVSIPSHPNYRLGPLDGSSCDTLGLDNHPLANYRWEQEDSTDILSVTFTDLSSYEPDSWTWDFGDGTGSTERYPAHQYDTAGIYTACLIVKNEYSADTFCQVLVLGVQSGAMDLGGAEEQFGYSLFPNPANDEIVVQLSPRAAKSGGTFSLFDAYGRVMASQTYPAETETLHFSVSMFAEGMYFHALITKDGLIQSGKVLVSH